MADVQAKSMVIRRGALTGAAALTISALLMFLAVEFTALILPFVLYSPYRRVLPFAVLTGMLLNGYLRRRSKLSRDTTT